MFQWLAWVVRTVSLTRVPPRRALTHGSMPAGIVVAPRQSGTTTPLRKIWKVCAVWPAGINDWSISKVKTSGFSFVAVTSRPVVGWVRVIFTCWLRNVKPVGEAEPAITPWAIFTTAGSDVVTAVFNGSPALTPVPVDTVPLATDWVTALIATVNVTVFVAPTALK